MSAITIVLILVAMVALAALELWLFWWLGDRSAQPGRRDQHRSSAANGAARLPRPGSRRRSRSRPWRVRRVR